MKTALYMRVSTLEQVQEGYSLQSQKRKLIAYCEAMGWSVYKIYADEGISGASIKKRPAVLQMINDIKNGEIENVLIVKVDRLCRNTKELLEIVDILNKHNVRLNAVDEKIDYTTDVGKMVLTMLGSFAEFERNRITQRFKEGRQQKVMQGIKSKSGKVLYGYKYENNYYHALPLESEVIRKIYELALENKSIHEIARIIGTNPHYNYNNIEWNTDRVRRILKNPTYKGYTFTAFFKNGRHINYDALQVKATNIDPIVDEITWDKVNTILRSRVGSTQRKFSIDDFAFGDVAYCGVCGKKMYARNTKSKNNKRRYYYRCYYKRQSVNLDDSVKACPVCCVENSTAERLFLEYFHDLTITPIKPTSSVDTDDNKTIQEIQRQLNAIELKRISLSKKFVEELISTDVYSQLNQEYNQEYENLTTRLNLLQNKKSATANIDYDTLLKLKVSLKEMWGLMNTSEKRTFITLHFEKVYITKERITKVVFRNLA